MTYIYNVAAEEVNQKKGIYKNNQVIIRETFNAAILIDFHLSRARSFPLILGEMRSIFRVV